MLNKNDTFKQRLAAGNYNNSNETEDNMSSNYGKNSSVSSSVSSSTDKEESSKNIVKNMKYVQMLRRGPILK